MSVFKQLIESNPIYTAAQTGVNVAGSVINTYTSTIGSVGNTIGTISQNLSSGNILGAFQSATTGTVNTVKTYIGGTLNTAKEAIGGSLSAFTKGALGPFISTFGFTEDFAKGLRQIMGLEDGMLSYSNGFLTGGFSFDTTGYTDDYYNSLANDVTDYSDNSPAQTRLGNSLTAGGNISYSAFKNKPVSVFGMPLNFSPLADPYGRVYSKMFMEDLPLVYLTPGVPRFNRKLKTGNGNLFDKIISGDAGGIIIPSAKNGDDVRFISFKSDFYNYYKYVSIMLSYCYSMMDVGSGGGVSDSFSFDDYYNIGNANTINRHGLAYFATKATTASESFSNNYGTSTLANNANQKAQEMREQRQISNMTIGGLLTSLVQNITEGLKNLAESLPVIGAIVSPFCKTLNGSQMYYPDIWNDSSIDRSYDICIKLYSPYGDAASIFKNIMVPLLSLTALALPRADGIYGYQEPFLVRCNCPGWFECECGAITSIDIKRGGDDNLWTVEGYPNEIDVTISVKDLYPTLLNSNSAYSLKYNKGLRSYLECMSGLRIDDISPLKTASAMKNVYGTNFSNAISLKGFGVDIGNEVQGAANNAVSGVVGSNVVSAFSN